MVDPYSTAKERAAVHTPPPRFRPVPAGLATAAISFAVFDQFARLVDVWADADMPIINRVVLGVSVVAGVSAYAYFALQERAFYRQVASIYNDIIAARKRTTDA
jgi:hypothetical protein